MVDPPANGSTLGHGLWPAPGAGEMMVGPTRSGSNRVFFLRLQKVIRCAVLHTEDAFNLKLKWELILNLPFSTSPED